MKAFDYLSVLISIVLGFGLSELLGSAARLVAARDRVKLYMPAVLNAAALALVFVQSWWAIFALRDRVSWNFLQFCVVLVHPLLLGFAGVLALPRDGGPVIDLKAHFHRQAPWYFGVLAAVVVFSALRAVAFNGRLPMNADMAFHVVFLVVMVSGAVIRAPRYHQIMAPVLFTVLLAYIGLLFARLG